jgi:hypothetical protein
MKRLKGEGGGVAHRSPAAVVDSMSEETVL